MFNIFFSIRKFRNAQAVANSSISHSSGPSQPQPFSSQPPATSARIDYDIPTYIRRGIKLSVSAWKN
ncbi:hypothetical protein [Methylocaldum sp.]|uniref:hypothetical protein n=1 Tax=Methylocaldum sp. TaxID=1969727 RepID=UPI002D3C87FC|nr:hypothetical protein [Methylocaldum sp.]HYE36746.1 hypothetical protein [Methylocaldum sp.]